MIRRFQRKDRRLHAPRFIRARDPRLRPHCADPLRSNSRPDHRQIHPAHRRIAAHPLDPDAAQDRQVHRRRRLRGRCRRRERAAESRAPGVHPARHDRRHRLRRQDRLEDRAVAGEERSRASRRRRDERNPRGFRLRQPARRLQNERQQGRVHRHRAGRRNRCLQGEAHPRQRRRAHLLLRHRRLRADQDRAQADGSRRGARVRDHPRRLQGSLRLVSPARRRVRRQGKLVPRRHQLLEDRGQCPHRPRTFRKTGRGRAGGCGTGGSDYHRGDGKRSDSGPGNTREQRAGEGRFRNDLRPRRAQHRLGGDERPHRGGRRGARGRQAPHRLRRRGQRRRLEVGRTAARPSSRSSTSSRCSRSAPSRSIRRIRRPSGSAPARRGRATASRSATASTSRPTAARPGRTWACKDSERIAKIARRPDATATPSTPACPASSGATATTAASTRRPTAARPGRKVLEGRESLDRLLDDRRWTRRTRRRSTPACGTSAARAGRSAPAATAGRAERQRLCSKSTDGGTTWTELDAKSATGLPAKPWGRVAVAVAPSKPNVVYAFIEVEPPRTALYRSDDGGKTWERARPQPDHGLAAVLLRATSSSIRRTRTSSSSRTAASSSASDGGKSFSDIGGGAHGDFHDVWIDPAEHRSRHRRRRRRPLVLVRRRQPLVEGEQPADLAVLPRERRHGPTRTTSTAACRTTAPGSATRRIPGGITNAQWENMYGGDGFWMFADPSDPDYIYAECAGRRHRPRQSQDARDARHPAATRATRKESCASTGTRRST